MSPQNQPHSERFKKPDPPPIPDEVPEDRLIVCVGLKAFFNVGERKEVKLSKSKQ